MPLWGNVDNAANSDIAVLAQVNRNISTAQRTALYGNLTANVYKTGVTIGQFGVDNDEMAASSTTSQPQHAGWVLRTEGSGGRAGRVQYETLVAMGSMTGDGEDSVFPDRRIIINTQPTSNTWAGPNTATLIVNASTVPTAGTLAYKCQQRYTGATAWANVRQVGTFTGNSSNTLVIANNQIASGNTFRVLVYVTGANTTISSNAIVTST